MVKKQEEVASKKLRLSASRCATYVRCHKLYWWTYNEQLMTKGKSYPLRIGSLVHRLKHQYNIGKINLDALANYDQVVTKLFPDVQGQEAVQMATDAVSLFSGFISAFENDPITVVSSETHLEHDRGEYILYARVDELDRTQDGRLWRGEHKTTARLDSAYLSGLKGSIQAGITFLLLKKTIPEPVMGTLYNLIVKTKVPQYYRTPILMEKTLEGLTEAMLKGVYEGITQERFEPSMQCFTYNRACDFLPLCKNDNKKTREAFYEHRPDEVPKNDGEEDEL